MHICILSVLETPNEVIESRTCGYFTIVGCKSKVSYGCKTCIRSSLSFFL